MSEQEEYVFLRQGRIVIYMDNICDTLDSVSQKENDFILSGVKSEC